MRNWFLLVIVAVLLGTAIAVALNPTIIQNTGQIKTVDIDVQPKTLEWGILDPGASADQTVMVKPVGNVPVTITYSLSNWQPAATQDYITVTWNYTGVPLQVGVDTPIKFTITINPAITGIVGFSFDVTITAVA